MIKDFIKEIQSRLEGIGDVFYKTTSKTSDFISWDFEIYDKSYGKYIGQIVIDVKYDDIMDILNTQQLIINALQNYTYCSETSSASVYGLILNDMSDMSTKKYYSELRFEFDLY